MTSKKFKAIQEWQERKVLKRVTGTDREDLFWIRIDIGEEFLRSEYDESEFIKHRNSKVFWNWWIRVWNNNDKIVLATMDKKGLDTVNRALYIDIVKIYINDRHWVIPKVIQSINEKITV